MNIMTTEKMNKQLFDEWQEKLFRFVFENKRKFTEFEWRWMRYQFEIEHMQTEQEDSPLALAADGNDIRAAWEARNDVPRSQRFQVTTGEDQYVLVITPGKYGVELSLEKNGMLFTPSDNNTPVIEMADGQQILLPSGFKDLTKEEFFKYIVSKISLDGGKNFIDLSYVD